MNIDWDKLKEWALMNGKDGVEMDEVFREWLMEQYTKCEDQYQ